MDEHAQDPGRVRLDDPWHDTVASGGRASDPDVPGPQGQAGSDACRDGDPVGSAQAAEEVYLTVHRSAAFQEVRRRYRRFVLPASIAFLAWYLAYVIASTTARDLMARPIVGGLNVAMAAGLGQFATTFLLTWAYSRHARLRRDPAALELRWLVYEQNLHHDTAAGEAR